MNWIKLKIDYYSSNMEESKNKIMSILSELGINQVELIDNFLENKLDYNVNNYRNEIWSIIGYAINNRFVDTKIKMIIQNINDIQDEEFIYEIYTSNCSDSDWKDEWKKYFNTTKITNKITVKPSWKEYILENEDEIVIEIDPGMAFGTGVHETTALCIEQLEKYTNIVDKKENLLDIGCGSGILMLVAKKLGINYVDGIDIDKHVESVVKENFEKNKIIDGYSVIIGNLVDDINKKYDIVVSNILVDTLMKLIVNIEKVIHEDSIVIFSGILNEKANMFIEFVSKYNLTMIDNISKGNWTSITFKYKK